MIPRESSKAVAWHGRRWEVYKPLRKTQLAETPAEAHQKVMQREVLESDYWLSQNRHWYG